IVTHGLIRQPQVLVQRQFGFDIFRLQNAMVSANGFFGRNFAIGDQAQHFDKSQLMLDVVDLASKESDACAILLGIVDQLKRVIGGSSAAAQDANNDVRVIL